MQHQTIIGFALAAALCASPAQAQDLTGTLKNIKETGAITLGHRDSSIPFSYLDDEPEADRLRHGHLPTRSSRP